MSHLLFLAVRTAGLPAEVIARNSALYSDVEDLSSVEFKYPTGAEGRFTCSWSVPGYPILQVRLEVRGEKGSLAADQFGLHVRLDEPHGGLPAGSTRLDLSDLSPQIPFDPAFENNGLMFVAQDSAFLDSVANGTDMETDARNAVASEHLIASIYRSAETGALVHVNGSGEPE
jgi:predicted dehydrogenase